MLLLQECERDIVVRMCAYGEVDGQVLKGFLRSVILMMESSLEPGNSGSIPCGPVLRKLLYTVHSAYAEIYILIDV